MSDPRLTGRWATDAVRCPRCGCRTLVNDAGDRWCSFVGGASIAACAWGLDAPVRWADGDPPPWSEWEDYSDEHDAPTQRLIIGATSDDHPVWAIRVTCSGMDAWAWTVELDDGQGDWHDATPYDAAWTRGEPVSGASSSASGAAREAWAAIGRIKAAERAEGAP